MDDFEDLPWLYPINVRRPNNNSNASGNNLVSSSSTNGKLSSIRNNVEGKARGDKLLSNVKVDANIEGRSSIMTDNGSSIVTDNGSSIITDNGSSIVTDNGSSVITDNGSDDKLIHLPTQRRKELSNESRGVLEESKPKGCRFGKCSIIKVEPNSEDDETLVTDAVLETKDRRRPGRPRKTAVAETSRDETSNGECAPILCLYCPDLVYFEDYKQRIAHNKRKHPVATKFPQCVYCDKKNAYKDWVKHNCEKHDGVYFACFQCRLRFSTKEDRDAHVCATAIITIDCGERRKRVHADCRRCGVRFASEALRDKHLLSHDYEDFCQATPNDVALFHFCSNVASENVADNLTNYVGLKTKAGFKLSGDRISPLKNPLLLRFDQLYGEENTNNVAFMKIRSRFDIFTQLENSLISSDPEKTVVSGLTVKNPVLSYLELLPVTQNAEAINITDSDLDEPIEFSGELVLPRAYVCSVCFKPFSSLPEITRHQSISHRRTRCRHLEYPLGQELLPIRGMELSRKRTNGGSMEEIARCAIACTKCKARYASKQTNEAHRHILRCYSNGNGDTESVSTPTKKRILDSRRKKDVARKVCRGLKRKRSTSPKEQVRKRVNRMSETIKKMIADLPPKRIPRRVEVFVKKELKTPKKLKSKVNLALPKNQRGRPPGSRNKKPSSASKKRNLSSGNVVKTTTRASLSRNLALAANLRKFIFERQLELLKNMIRSAVAGSNVEMPDFHNRAQIKKWINCNVRANIRRKIIILLTNECCVEETPEKIGTRSGCSKTSSNVTNSGGNERFLRTNIPRLRSNGPSSDSHSVSSSTSLRNYISTNHVVPKRLKTVGRPSSIKTSSPVSSNMDRKRSTEANVSSSRTPGRPSSINTSSPVSSNADRKRSTEANVSTSRTPGRPSSITSSPVSSNADRKRSTEANVSTSRTPGRPSSINTSSSVSSNADRKRATEANVSTSRTPGRPSSINTSSPISSNADRKRSTEANVSSSRMPDKKKVARNKVFVTPANDQSNLEGVHSGPAIGKSLVGDVSPILAEKKLPFGKQAALHSGKSVSHISSKSVPSTCEENKPTADVKVLNREIKLNGECGEESERNKILRSKLRNYLRKMKEGQESLQMADEMLLKRTAIDCTMRRSSVGVQKQIDSTLTSLVQVKPANINLAFQRNLRTNYAKPAGVKVGRLNSDDVETDDTERKRDISEVTSQDVITASTIGVSTTYKKTYAGDENLASEFVKASVSPKLKSGDDIYEKSEIRVSSRAVSSKAVGTYRNTLPIAANDSSENDGSRAQKETKLYASSSARKSKVTMDIKKVGSKEKCLLARRRVNDVVNKSSPNAFKKRRKLTNPGGGVVITKSTPENLRQSKTRKGNNVIGRSYARKKEKIVQRWWRSALRRGRKRGAEEKKYN